MVRVGCLCNGALRMLVCAARIRLKLGFFKAKAPPVLQLARAIPFKPAQESLLWPVPVPGLVMPLPLPLPLLLLLPFPCKRRLGPVFDTPMISSMDPSTVSLPKLNESRLLSKMLRDDESTSATHCAAGR